MKCFIPFLVYLLAISTSVSAQSKNFIHPSILEVNFSLSDFNNIEGQTKMPGGLGIGFTKGISKHFDWRIGLMGSYTGNIVSDKPANSEKSLLLETDATIRARLFPRKTTIQPYAQAGIGFSMYRSYYDCYIPAGIGIQISVLKDAYVLINSQYRFSITNTIGSHFQHSIGLAGTIGKKKPVTIPKKEVPPPAINISARDRDNDGIVDTADACPDQPGLAIYKGCPPPKEINKEISNDIKAKLDLAARAIYFETGNANLLQTSYTALDEVLYILQQDTALKLSIEGHTDNVGTPASNEILSRNRAQSVLNYLKSKGIDEARLTAKGFGQTLPIADNDTPEGRAKNRRVDLKPSY